MNLEQRKSQLINWISSLKNEELLSRLEELKKVGSDVPSSIMELLIASSNSEKLVKHNSAKQLVK